MSAERAVDVATINTIDDNGQHVHSGAGTILNTTDQGYGESRSSQYDQGEGRESHQRLVASMDRYPPQSQSQLESGSDLPIITMSNPSSDLAPAIPTTSTSVSADPHTASEPPFNLQIAELIPNNDTTNINTNKYNNNDALDLEPIDVKHPIIHVDSPRSSLEREKGEIKHRALEPVMEGPKLNIRILLMSGQSHTFAFPPTTTIGHLKDLVWGEWPADWNPEPGRPPAPNYFRLLFMGRMLTDPEVLSALNLKPAPNSTIVHLSIRTFAPAPEEPPKKSILPFSLPTIPRPSGLSSRQNSSNIPTTAAPGSGTGGSPHVPPGARAESTSAIGAGAGNTTATQGTTGQTGRRAAGGDEHGGGCKCLIQ
ncbi:hypothetical protein FFLO_02322 [Filobasidium floriforme]|uniref:Ubiquitin-like domain-containing protein n=1 Tax=Filobasidium floriforme TaxID=5210 RepID=A0A8K0JN54_9TREE|nr:uncharacterized protein HD553DRAFT_316991 [Filobasidium floriforme]KAG7562236.1 hypothetical protein FFLO_02322 [Filobasidium floriforme]KAH8080539.1 hypothetical protein HD553DRAFT_316991 [Filobasidium floriforme]